MTTKTAKTKRKQQRESAGGRFEPEDRITLTELAQELDVALSTVWRWTKAGVRGHKLKTIPVGGRTYTTEAFYREFQANIRGDHQPDAPAAKPKSPAKHKRVGKRLSRAKAK